MHVGQPWGVKTIRERLAPAGRQETALRVRPGVVGQQLSDIQGHLIRLEGKPDVDVSLALFKRWRETTSLLSLTCCALDFDIETLADGQSPITAVESRIDAVIHQLDQNEIPRPNLLVRTGRGFHIYWLFERTLPAAGITRWRAVMTHLLKLTASLRPDMGVSDPTRVLRLVGTVNSKVVDENGHPWRVRAEVLRRERVSFETLQDTVLPYTRAEVHDFRARQAAKIQKRLENQQNTAPGGPLLSDSTKASPQAARSHYRQFARADKQLAWLSAAVIATWPNGEVPEGWRDKVLFAAGCFLSWLAEPDVLRTAIERFAVMHTPGISPGAAVRSHCSAVITRADKAAAQRTAGELVTLEDDPRYKVGKRWIENNLGDIFAGHMTGLHNTLKKAQRRKGTYSLIGVAVANLADAIKAHELRGLGQTLKEIGKALGGRPAKTIKSWLQVELTKLQDALQASEDKSSSGQPPARQSSARLYTLPTQRPLASPPGEQAPEPQGVLPKTFLYGLSPSNQGFEKRPRGGGLGAGSETPVQPVDNLVKVPERATHPTKPHKKYAQVLDLIPKSLMSLDVAATLEKAGCHVKKDLSFVPRGDPKTLRYYVSLPGTGRVVELIVTELLWWAGTEFGGGKGGASAARVLLKLTGRQIARFA